MARLQPTEYTPQAVEAATRGSVNLSDLKVSIRKVTTPGTANAEFVVKHGLTYAPTHFLQLSPNVAGVVYKSNKRRVFDTANAYLKCNVASMEVELVFA